MSGKSEPKKRGRRSLTTYEDVYMAVELLMKTMDRGVTIGEIASVVFPNQPLPITPKALEYEAVYYCVKTHPDLVEVGRMKDKGNRTLWAPGRRTPVPDATIPNNGSRSPAPPAPLFQGLPHIPKDELRGHLAKVIDALEALQENMGPLMALLLDLDRDYVVLTKAKHELASLKHTLDGVKV